MAFVFSPSNIMAYRQCPRKFWGQSISKLIKYKPTKQKSRGIILHEQIQDALRDANKFAPIQEDVQVDAEYVSRCVAGVHADRAASYKLFIEHELCMNKAGAQVGWWDDKAFLRAKADAFLLHDNPQSLVRVIDIKTGKNWDKDHTQLRLEALLAHIIYRRPVVLWEYWYIDQGQTERGIIEFDQGLAPVQDLYDTMREMGQSIRNNDFPCVKNGLCRRCDFYKTENCDVFSI